MTTQTAATLSASIIGKWIIEHKTEIVNESTRRNLHPDQFVVIMLEDALDAYRQGREVYDDVSY